MPASPTRKRRREKSAAVAYLSLVSLMDMFTIILIFLMHSFSTSGETVTTTQEFRLPVSTATEAIKPRLLVQITAKDIVVEGERVTGTDTAAAEGLMIEPLYLRLKKEAEKTLFIAGVNPSLELSREVVILGDRRIPFNLLQKVMYTCGQVGYNNISLAVMSLE